MMLLPRVSLAYEESYMRAARDLEPQCRNAPGRECVGQWFLGRACPRFELPGSRDQLRSGLCVLCERRRVTREWYAELHANRGAACTSVLHEYAVAVDRDGEYNADVCLCPIALSRGEPVNFVGVLAPYPRYDRSSLYASADRTRVLQHGLVYETHHSFALSSGPGARRGPGPRPMREHPELLQTSFALVLAGFVCHTPNKLTSRRMPLVSLYKRCLPRRNHGKLFYAAVHGIRARSATDRWFQSLMRSAGFGATAHLYRTEPMQSLFAVQRHVALLVTQDPDLQEAVRRGMRPGEWDAFAGRVFTRPANNVKLPLMALTCDIASVPRPRIKEVYLANATLQSKTKRSYVCVDCLQIKSMHETSKRAYQGFEEVVNSSDGQQFCYRKALDGRKRTLVMLRDAMCGPDAPLDRSEFAPVDVKYACTSPMRELVFGLFEYEIDGVHRRVCDACGERVCDMTVARLLFGARCERCEPATTQPRAGFCELCRAPRAKSKRGRWNDVRAVVDFGFAPTRVVGFCQQHAFAFQQVARVWTYGELMRRTEQAAVAKRAGGARAANKGKRKSAAAKVT